MFIFMVYGLITLFAMLWFGMWIGSAVGIAAIVSLSPLGWDKIMYMSAVQTWAFSESFTLAAVPLYVFMGEIVFQTGVVGKLSDGFLKLTRGALPGGLLQSTMMSTVIFAACTGSSTASAATFSSLAYPEMAKKRHYDEALTLGTIATGGSLGMLIPPSIIMVLYGSLADVSVGQVYLGGVLPGLLLAGLFMTYIAVRAMLNPSLAPQEKVGHRGGNWGLFLSGAVDVAPFLGLIVLVVGTIYLGIATATEAAALGVVGAALLGAGYGKLTKSVIWTAAHGAIKVTAMAYFIIFATKTLSMALAYTGLVNNINAFVKTLPSGVLVLIAVSILYLIMGCLFDSVSILLITVPFIVPALKTAGFDLVFVGVYLTVLIEIGVLTPPVGTNLFVMQGTTGASLMKVAKGSFPFVVIMLLGLVILYFVPGLALWLPSQMAAKT